MASGTEIELEKQREKTSEIDETNTGDKDEKYIKKSRNCRENMIHDKAIIKGF